MGTYTYSERRIPRGGPARVSTRRCDYLIGNVNHNGSGYEQGPGGLRESGKGKRVVVLGGGDTAMDCVRTADSPAQQAEHRDLRLSPRTRINMPGSRREVIERSVEEGVEFLFNRQPIEVVEYGRVQACVHQDGALPELGPNRMLEDGRRRPEPIPGSERGACPADAVIIAFGFQPQPPRLAGREFGGPDQRLATAA